jgi:tRNA(fMet)-specific endonuclease VapC
VSWCLDTNTIVYFLKGTHAGIRDRLAELQPQQVAVSEVVVAELLFGVERSQRKASNLAKVTAFLAPFRRLSFDEKVSPHYAEIRAYLADRGELIGPNDLLIAATARAHGLTLVTHNTVEFSRVIGLKLEDWVL